MVIAAAIIKGGTGKTTTAAALLQAAVYDKKRALAVDLDPQANLTACLAASSDQEGAWHLLHGSPAATCLEHTEQGIDVIGASSRLATETSFPASAQRLRTGLDPILSEYDLIIIDTPPTMSELTFNALYAADEVLIPVEADSGSVQGLYQIADIAKEVAGNSKRTHLLGQVVTRFSKQATLSNLMLERLQSIGKDIGAPVLATIRQGIAIREAQALGKSLYQYKPNSHPAEDYLHLYAYIQKKYKSSLKENEV